MKLPAAVVQRDLRHDQRSQALDLNPERKGEKSQMLREGEGWGLARMGYKVSLLDHHLKLGQSEDVGSLDWQCVGALANLSLNCRLDHLWLDQSLECLVGKDFGLNWYLAVAGQ